MIRNAPKFMATHHIKDFRCLKCYCETNNITFDVVKKMIREACEANNKRLAEAKLHQDTGVVRLVVAFASLRSERELGDVEGCGDSKMLSVLKQLSENFWFEAMTTSTSCMSKFSAKFYQKDEAKLKHVLKQKGTLLAKKERNGL